MGFAQTARWWNQRAPEQNILVPAPVNFDE
jgi:hypothetical protein